MKFKDILPWKQTQNAPVSTGESNPFELMRKEFDRVFDNFGNNLFTWPESSALSFLPKLDIGETQKQFNLHMELPGIEPNEVQIEVDGDYLLIRGEKSTGQKEKDGRWHKQERVFGSFQRSLLLPTEADASQIKALFDNGVLKITIPKYKDAVREAKTIPIQS